MPCSAAKVLARSIDRDATATASAPGTSGKSATTFDAIRPGPTIPQRTVMAAILPPTRETSASRSVPGQPEDETGERPVRVGEVVEDVEVVARQCRHLDVEPLRLQRRAEVAGLARELGGLRGAVSQDRGRQG